MKDELCKHAKWKNQCHICRPINLRASSSNDGLCVDCRLKAAMDDFGKRLLENQEPLSPEFQKVIDDNYWELLTEECYGFE